MNDIGRNIRSLREAAGMSMEQLGDAIGKTRSAISQYESGRIVPRMGVVEDLARVFGVPKSAIIGESQRIYAWVPVPRFGRIAAGSPLTMEEVDDFVDVPDAVRRRHPDGFCLTVEGESMNNILPNGCHAYVVPCTEVEHDGAPYAVCVNGCDATIKRVRKLANGFELLPDSNDPTFRPAVYDHGNPDDDKVTIIGRVVYYVIPYDWEF